MTEIIRSASISGVRLVGARVTAAERRTAQEDEENRNDDASNEGFLGSHHQEDRLELSGAYSDVLDSAQDRTVDNPQSPAEENNARSEDWQRQVLSSLQSERDELKEDNIALAETLSELQEKFNELSADMTRTFEENSDKGFKQGYLEGIDTAQQQVDERLKEAQQVAGLFSEAINAKLENIERLSADIGFAALIKLVGEHLGDEKFSKAYILSAVEQVRSEAQLDVHISPDDYQILTRHGELLEFSKALPNINFVEDSRVGLGGCFIESDHGSWDARLEAQLQRLKDALKNADEHTD